ncbi:MAG: ATP-grasp domain-containing protein [Clostridia bacterium]|nr:ATP-grasp domain-containing protein [Clostridia bacterium]
MKKVMILGAGLLQSYVIKRAKDLGYETIVLDMDENAIGRKYADKFIPINIVDKEECLEVAQENNIDGVLTAATDYGVITSAYIANKMGLPGLDVSVAAIIKNKYDVRRILYENGADDTNQFFEITDINDVDEVCKEAIFPLIVKPCDGSGSKGVCKVNSKDELKLAIKDALEVSLSKKALAETFIVGNEYGVESFVHNNEIHILGIMKKEMTKPPFYAELGHCIPSKLPNNIEKKVKEVAEKAIKSLGINFGAVNMDLLITSDGKVCIVDIGARMGGNLIGSHIIPLSSGIDYMGNIIKCAVGDNPDFQRKYDKPIATRLLALTPGEIIEVPDFSKYNCMDNLEVVCKLKEGDVINKYKNNLDGCGYVVAKGDGIDECIKMAEKAKNDIDREIKRK